MCCIKIGKQEIGMGNRPYFIADIGSNHDGSLERAFELIKLAKEAGANAAKFQNFKAETIVSRNGFDTMREQLSHQKKWKKSVFEVYKEASIPDEWSLHLREKCNEVGIEYMTSPYDFESVDIADRYSRCFKIGSGDITWLEIIEHIAKKDKPVLLATGASSMEDVERAMATIKRYNNKIILMQCNTNYTASGENFKYINLNVLKTYASKYPGVILGLSDHTLGHETVLGAITLGARVIEKHFTDDNTRIGPDHKFSMTPQTWREMVKASTNLFYALGDGVKKVEKNEEDTVVLQRRAIYVNRNLNKGDIITEKDIFPLRPIKKGEIPPYKTYEIVGKSLVKNIKKDTSLKWEDIK